MPKLRRSAEKACLSTFSARLLFSLPTMLYSSFFSLVALFRPGGVFFVPARAWIGCSLTLCLLFAATIAHAGETIVYGNTQASTGAGLQDINIGHSGNARGSLFPGAPGSLSASDNTITVDYTSGTDPDSVFGGLSDSAAVIGNTVNFLNGTIDATLYGGYDAATSNGAGAKNNIVNISGGTIGVDLVSGMSDTGDATDNHVIVSGSANIKGEIYGGLSFDDGNAVGNSVTMRGGTALGITGGLSDSNTTDGSGGAFFNTVTLEGGSVDETVFGGYDFGTNGGGSVHNNHVILSGASVGENLIAGMAGNGFASDNIVTMTSGSVGEYIYGGQSESNNSAATDRNQVSISGASTVGKDVIGGFSHSGSAQGNTVKLSGGTINGDAFGARITNGSGNAEGNSVSIEGTAKIQGSILGAYSLGSGNVAGNSVTMTGGTVDGSIVGGRGTSGNATGNRVLIAGGKVNENVFGGYSGSGTATNNTVVISGTPVFGANSLLQGGHSSSGDARTGNILEVRSPGHTAFNIRNFQHLRFYLPSTITAGATMLTLTDPSGVDISSTASPAAPTTLGVGIMGGGAQLKANDRVTLIQATGSLTADPNMTNNISAMQGISSVYELELQVSANAVDVLVTKTGQSDSAIRKSPSGGKAASVALVAQGADLAAGQGMGNARQAAGAASRSGAGAAGMGMAGFSAMSGGTARYNTDSHVDVNSLSLMTGLAKRWEGTGADWLTGVFLEAGWGSYNSYNSMEDGSDVKGKGNSRYYGGGLLGRVDVTESAAKGLYAEATFRVGGLHSDYNSNDLNPALGRASYDTSATYYGAHAGLGYIWELTSSASLDLYGKYFWTHTTGTNVRILGDPVEFKAVDSYRTRLGARFSYEVNDYITPYIGAAWDYEFDGKARSVVAGVDAPAPSLMGSTGVGELGLTWKPAVTSPLSVDFGMLGYVGMRQGVSGNLQLRYEF